MAARDAVRACWRREGRVDVRAGGTSPGLPALVRPRALDLAVGVSVDLRLHAHLLQDRDVGLRDDPAHQDQDVVPTLFA